jgi:hypothetical protein
MQLDADAVEAVCDVVVQCGKMKVGVLCVCDAGKQVKKQRGLNPGMQMRCMTRKILIQRMPAKRPRGRRAEI